MGNSSVARAPGKWGFKSPELAAEAQAIIATGFRNLTASAVLPLAIDAKGARPRGAWIDRLEVTTAEKDVEKDKRTAVQIAFSYEGLVALGLHEDDLATFSLPFRDGMTSGFRRKVLSDDEGAIVPGGLQWHGNPDRDEDAAPQAGGPRHVVHALLLLYAATDAELDGLKKKVRTALSESCVTVLPTGVDTKIEDSLFSDQFNQEPTRKTPREHFGFADGFSQPVPYGLGEAQDPWHAMALGDLLFGYPNAYGDVEDGARIREDRAQGLLPPASTTGYCSLGHHGTYLVARQLEQHVFEFWKAMDNEAARLRALSGATEEEINGLWLAQRAIGRGCHGDMGVPDGKWFPRDNDQPGNAFGYFRSDPNGFGCPFGSHTRRANPRDGLDRRATEGKHAGGDGPADPVLLKSVNNHRIMRRGRTYGPRVHDPRDKDESERDKLAGNTRGLFFMCLNTDIVRQFEFIQETWLLSASFGSLYQESDPILGPRAFFTIPRDPVRLRADLQRFIYLVGGDYYFLPGLRALKFLAQVKPGP